MKTIQTIAVSSLLLLAAGVQAQINVPVSALGSVNTPYSATLTLNHQSVGVAIDPFTINSALVTTTPSDPAEITAISRTAIWFCMDPLQYIYQNTSKPLIYQSTDPDYFNKYDDTSLSTSLTHGGGLNTTEINSIKALFTQNYIAATQNTTLGLEKAAALQLAIWEVANENNGSTNTTAYTLNSGNFSITNVKINGNADNSSGSYTNLITMANSMLAAIPSAGPFTGSLDFLIDGKQTSSNGYSTYQVQDLVGWDPPSPIPESSNFATGALGLLGLAALVKLRRQKSKAAV